MATSPNNLRWFGSGGEFFPAMLEAINAARASVRLETYIYTSGIIGCQFLAALTAAARRGVRVSVLVDALGSWQLPGGFFNPLTSAGGKVSLFNPLQLWRVGVRNHRKLLVCDDANAFIGGFNLADEFNGDGISCGWFDIGLRLENTSLIAPLAASFDEMFKLADFRRRPLLRLRAFKRRRKSVHQATGKLLLSQPGRGASPFQSALHHDLARARDTRIITAYFFPTRRVRRYLMQAARRGGRVQLILAGRSDVLLSQLAARSLYQRMLRAGVEIYEYQPQILHAKLILTDGVTYAGSSNLDIRSLNLNYELMVRFADKAIASGAQALFEQALQRSRRIERDPWLKSLSSWRRWKQRWARFLVARIDPFLALRQFEAVKK